MIGTLLLAASLVLADPGACTNYHAPPSFDPLVDMADIAAPEPPAPPAWASGRLVTLPLLHVGVRGHGYFDGVETAAAVTMQLRFDESLGLVWRGR